ncbi:MAG: hypothetical protein FJZ92_00805 [Chloroflexi bacterium]|nr:hypothetical protein [Chloroflexota bacterium]
MLDNGVETDLHAITQNIDEAEVVSLYFPALGKTLLIDNRASEHVGPMVRIVPMADSSAERLRSVRRMRPELPRPTSLTLIPWTRRVDSLCVLGVWEHITARLHVHADAPTYLAEASRCLAALRRLETREIRSAITGNEYRTIWRRSGGADC